MTDDEGLGSLRPVTVVLLGSLILAWSAWKLYKMVTLGPYGFLSWQYLGATGLGVVTFIALVGGILWLFENRSASGSR
jgi:hypothetical protein